MRLLPCSVFVVGLLLAAPAMAAPHACIAPSETATFINKDICVRAHVYNVVQLRSGTRFLDVCSPETPNSACRFTIMSLAEDSGDVGPLDGLRDTDIEIRGRVRNFSDHREMLLTHVRQLHGGAEKFRPNPELLQRYSASEHSMAFRDPNVKSGGRSGAVKPSTLPTK